MIIRLSSRVSFGLEHTTCQQCAISCFLCTEVRQQEHYLEHASVQFSLVGFQDTRGSETSGRSTAQPKKTRAIGSVNCAITETAKQFLTYFK